MTEFKTLPDDHPDLVHSPLLRAAVFTRYRSFGRGRHPSLSQALLSACSEEHDKSSEAADEKGSKARTIKGHWRIYCL
jgi:hypothetical protein